MSLAKFIRKVLGHHAPFESASFPVIIPGPAETPCLNYTTIPKRTNGETMKLGINSYNIVCVSFSPETHKTYYILPFSLN